MTKEQITKALERAREGLALVTFESSCYQPKKIDRRASESTAKKHGVSVGDVFVVKEIVSGPFFAAARAVLGRARRYHYNATRSWSGRRVGIIRGEDLFDYVKFMNDRRAEFKVIVDSILEQWPMMVEQQAERLNGLFRIEDYPTVDQLKRRFSLNYYINQMPVEPDWRLKISMEAVEEIAGSFEEQIQERIDTIKASILDETRGVLEHTLKILVKADPQSIRDSLVKNVRGQVDWIRSLNIQDDHRLYKLVNLIEGEVLKVDPDGLRESTSAITDMVDATRSAIQMIKEID